jgi:hypothetical protein
MRTSNKRPRNKNNNRNRSNNSGGNVVNRVFDSSGPDGKVRGTPQQIIDKYNQLARDAQLSNDRVNAENFQQHAEHYMRLLSEAQREQDARREQQEREQDARREQQERENRERQSQRDAERAARAEHEASNDDPARAPQPDLVDMASDSDSGLVETPEAKADEKPKKPRAPRKPRKKPEPRPETSSDSSTPDAAE